MPFVQVNPDNSIEDIFTVDIVDPTTEITDEEMEPINQSPVGHSEFDLIAGVVTPNAVKVTARLLDEQKLIKIAEIKAEAVLRMNEQVPVEDIQEVMLVKELWQSIAPAARQATVAWQWVMDCGIAGIDAANEVKALATIAEVNNYDPVNNPAWPVST